MKELLASILITIGMWGGYVPPESQNISSQPDPTFGVTAVFPGQGGTGTSTPPGFSQLLLGNLTGGYDLVSLVEGSNITLTTTTDTLTIASSGGGGGASALGDLSDVSTTTAPLFSLLALQSNGTYDSIATSTFNINTDDLVEGSNLFYTQARWDTAFSATTTWASFTTNFNTLFNATSTFGGNSQTATALVNNGSNCSSGNAPLGVNALGAVEDCFDVWTEAENTAAGYGTNDWQVLTANGSNYLRPTTTLNLFAPSRLGIGTTTPQALLSIATSTGVLTGDQMLFQVASTTGAGIENVLRVNADGTVVIGDDASTDDSSVLFKDSDVAAYIIGNDADVNLFAISAGGVLGSGNIFSANSAGSTIHGNATTSKWLNVGTTDVVSTYGSSIGDGDLHVGRNATVTNRLSSESIIIKGDADPSTQLSIERDNDATGGATMSLFHDTASPATSDAVGNILFHESRTSAQATKVEYGRITVLPTTVTASSEVGQMQFWTVNGGTSASRMSIQGNGNVGVGPTTPATRLDVDTESNTTGLRIRGLAETTEILDIFLGAAGNAAFSLLNGNDTGQFFQFFPEDDNFGIAQFANGSQTVYSNWSTLDAAKDYANLTVGVANTTAGLIVTEDEFVGVAKIPTTPFEVSDATNDLFQIVDGGTWGVASSSGALMVGRNKGALTLGLGDAFFSGTATSSKFHTTELCLGNDCKTAWPSSGFDGHFAQATTTNTVGGTLIPSANSWVTPTGTVALYLPSDLTVGGNATTSNLFVTNVTETNFLVSNSSYIQSDEFFIEADQGATSAYISGTSAGFEMQTTIGDLNFIQQDEDYQFFGNGQYGILNFSSIASSAKTFTFPNVTGNICVDTANNFFTGELVFNNASTTATGDFNIGGNASTTGKFVIGSYGTTEHNMGAGDLLIGDRATSTETFTVGTSTGVRILHQGSTGGSTTTLQFF